MSDGTPLVAVTGGSGYVGQFVLPALRGAGWRVRSLTRSPGPAAGDDRAIEWVAGDLTSPGRLAALTAGADAVVHLAYQHVPGRYRQGEGADLPGWYAANLQGSLALLLAAQAAGVAQFLFLSSRAVFSHTRPGQQLDEAHPISPDTHYGAYKAAVEALLQGFARQEGMATTAVRATGVYGRVQPLARSKWWPHICRAVQGQPVTERRGGTEVHGQDVARTVVELLRRGAAAPAVVHLSDLYVTTRQVVALAQQAAGISGPLPPPPDQPLRNPLVCTRLAELGIQLGGEPLLRRTVAELAREALAHAPGGG